MRNVTSHGARAEEGKGDNIIKYHMEEGGV